MLQERSAPATNVAIESVQRQPEGTGPHAAFRGFPGNLRTNPVAHGVVHIAALTVKKEFGDGISKEEEPTSSACGPPGGAQFPAGAPAFLPCANFADLSSSVPSLPPIRGGMNDGWLQSTVTALPHCFGQHGLQIGNLVSHILHVLMQRETVQRSSLSFPVPCTPLDLCINELILAAADSLHNPCSAVTVSQLIMMRLWTLVDQGPLSTVASYNPAQNFRCPTQDTSFPSPTTLSHLRKHMSSAESRW
jgi:hypothetical protein